MLGIYSSVKKAVFAAQNSFTSRNLTMSGSQAAIAMTSLRESPHGTARLQAPPNNPHAVTRRLDAIKALRHEHTRQFMRENWASMQTVTSKIVKAWADYHFSADCAKEKGVCFNCCKPAKDEFKVAVDTAERTLLFCSTECRMDFGVSIGLT